MFNSFSRFYVPGFRVGPYGVPGFNIDDNGLPQRASDSSDEPLPESAAQRNPDSAQPQSSPSISFTLPGAEGWVLSAPLIGSPGFRVSPQDDVPGFNVGPQDDAPGFSPDENGGQQQQPPWSYGLPPGSVTAQDANTAQTPTPPPLVDDPAPPALPPLPVWPYQFGTMLPPRLPTAFEPRIEINSLPSIGPDTVPGAALWPPYSAPQQPPGLDIRSRPATAQNPNLQPATQQAMRNAWLRPPTIGQPYAQANGGNLQDPWSVPIAPQAPEVPPTLSARPLADSILANAGDAGVRQAPQPLPQNKQAQQQIPASPPDTGRADTPPALRIHEKPSTEMTSAERQPEQELSQSIEEYRRAAANLTRELARALTRFGTRFYEDTILKAGSDLARLAERFADEPGDTAESLAASFPQTRVEGEFLAGIAAVFATLAANAERGLAFEDAVRTALSAAKNKTKISVEGLGRSVPDILLKGVTEIKSGLEIDNSVQLKVQATYAKRTGMPFNLVVSPTTRRVSKSVRELISETRGIIQRFDPATGSFTPFK
jgi:Restriction endonuclease fold toxin 7